jgi:hypothetical protein
MMWHRRPVLEFPNRECLQRLLDIQSAEVARLQQQLIDQLIINRDLVNQAADDAQ